MLGIADKVGASVLSNDSFQEFHGEYKWLFDEGRLIGGKPVPHIGWVWVDRVPVRGPISRKATRGGRRWRRRPSRFGQEAAQHTRDEQSTVRTGSKEASGPMPKPKSPPPGRAATAAKPEPARPKKAPKGADPVNELMPFLDFVEQHPVGTSVNGTVDAYSSHGAYITIADNDVRGYVPLRLMADPMPRSAKSVMKQGESVTVVVVSFAPARRSIDCAVPDMADVAIREATAADDDEATATDAVAEQAESGTTDAEQTATRKTAAKTKTAAKKKSASKKKTAAKKTAAKKKSAAVEEAPSKKKAASKKKSATKKTATKKAAAKKAATKKAAVKKTATKKKSAAVKKAPASKKAAAKKAPAKKKAAVEKVANTESAAEKKPATD